MEIDSLRVQLTDLLALHHDDDANEDDVVFATFDYIRYAHTVAQMLLLEGRFPELQRCLHLCQAAFGELAVADAVAADTSSPSIGSADRADTTSVAAVTPGSVAVGATSAARRHAGPLDDDGAGSGRSSSPGTRTASTLSSSSVNTAAAVAAASRRQSANLTLRSAEDRRVFAALASRTAQLQKQLEAAMRVRRGRDTEYYLQRLGLGARDDDADDVFNDDETAASIRQFRRQLQRLPRSAPMTLQLTPPPSSRGGALGVSATAGGGGSAAQTTAFTSSATTPARAPPPPSRRTAASPNDKWKTFRLPSLSVRGPFSATPPPPSAPHATGHGSGSGGGGGGRAALPVAFPATGGWPDAASPGVPAPPAPPERGIAIGGRSLLNRWKVRKELPPFVTAGRTFCVDREQAYAITSAAGSAGAGGVGAATGRGRLRGRAGRGSHTAQDDDPDDDAGLRAVWQLYGTPIDDDWTPQVDDETREPQQQQQQPCDSANTPSSPSNSSSSSEWGPPPLALGRGSPSPSYRRLHSVSRVLLTADGVDGEEGMSGVASVQVVGNSSTSNGVGSPHLSGRDGVGAVRGLSTSWLTQASSSRSRRRTAPGNANKRAAPGLATASVPASTVSGYAPSFPHGFIAGSPASGSGAASPSNVIDVFPMRRRHMLSVSTNTLASGGSTTTLLSPGLPLRVTLPDDSQTAVSTTSVSVPTPRPISRVASSVPPVLHVAHGALLVPPGPISVAPSLLLVPPSAAPAQTTALPTPQPILAPSPPASSLQDAARVVQVARQTTQFITASLKAQHHRTADALRRCDELAIQRLPHHARAAATAALESRNTTAPSSEASSSRCSASRGSAGGPDFTDGLHSSSPLSITTLGSPELPPSITAQLPERWVLPLARPPLITTIPPHASFVEAAGGSGGVPVVDLTPAVAALTEAPATEAAGEPLLTARVVIGSPPPPPPALRSTDDTAATTTTASMAATSLLTLTVKSTEATAAGAAAAVAASATPPRVAFMSSMTSAVSPVPRAGAAVPQQPSQEAERQLRELRLTSSRQLAASMAVVQAMEARWAEQHRQLETRVAQPRLQDLSEWRRQHHHHAQHQHQHQHHHRRPHQRHHRSGQTDGPATAGAGAAASTSHHEEWRGRHSSSPSPVPRTSVPSPPAPYSSFDYGVPVTPMTMTAASAVLQWEGSGSGVRQVFDLSVSGANFRSTLQRRAAGSESEKSGGSVDTLLTAATGATHPHADVSAAETALPSMPTSAQASPSLPPSAVPAAAALASVGPPTGTAATTSRSHDTPRGLHPLSSATASSSTSTADGDEAAPRADAERRSKGSGSEDSVDPRGAGATLRSMATILPLHSTDAAPAADGDAAPSAFSTGGPPGYAYHPVVDALVRWRRAGSATAAAAGAPVGAPGAPPPSVSAVAVAAAPPLYTVYGGDAVGHRVESTLDSWRHTLQAMDVRARPSAGTAAVSEKSLATTDTATATATAHGHDSRQHSSTLRLAASTTAAVVSNTEKPRARHGIHSVTDDARQRRTQRVLCDALREAAMHVRPGDLVRPAWKARQATQVPPTTSFFDLPNVFGGSIDGAGYAFAAAPAVASAAQSTLHPGTSVNPTLRSSAVRTALDTSLLSVGSTNASLSAGGRCASGEAASGLGNLTVSSALSSPAAATAVPSLGNTPYEIRISPSRHALPRTSCDLVSAWLPPTVGTTSRSSSQYASVMPSAGGAAAVFRQLHAVYRVGDVLLGCRDWTAVAPELLARSLHLSVRAVRLQQWWRRCLATRVLHQRRAALAAYLAEEERRDAAVLMLQRQVRVHWAREATATRAVACAILTEQRVEAERLTPRTAGGGSGEDDLGGSSGAASVLRANTAGSQGPHPLSSAGLRAPSTATSSSVPLVDARGGGGWTTRSPTGLAALPKMLSAHDTAGASVFFLSARAAVAAGTDGEGGDDEAFNNIAVLTDSADGGEGLHRGQASTTAASPLVGAATALPSTSNSPRHLGRPSNTSASAAAAAAAARRPSSRMPWYTSPVGVVRARPEQRRAAARKLQRWYRRRLARLEVAQLRRDVDVLSAVVTGRAPLEAVQLTLMPARLPQLAVPPQATDRSITEATQSGLGEVSFMSPFPVTARASASSSLMQVSAAAAATATALSASTAPSSRQPGEVQAMRRLLERCTGDVYGAFEERGRAARRRGDYKTPLERVSLRELQGLRLAREEEAARQRQLVEWEQRRRLEQQQRRERQVLDAIKTMQRFGRGFRWRRWVRERQLKIRRRLDNNQVDLLPRPSANEARDLPLTATDGAATLSMLTVADVQCAQLAGGAAVSAHMRLRLQAAHPQWFGTVPSVHSTQNAAAHPTPEQLDALAVVAAFVQGFSSAAETYERYRHACARSIQLAWRLFLVRRARRRARLRHTVS